MLSLLFLVFAAVHIGIWVWAFGEWNRQQRPVGLSLVLFGNLLLWYDNFRIGIGRFVGEGDLMQALSVPAFVWHWTILPIFVIVAGSILRLADFEWARNKLVMGAFCVVAVVLFALDVPDAVSLLFGPVAGSPPVQLDPACLADTLRYTTRVTADTLCDAHSSVTSYGPGPFVAIFMNVIMTGVGILLWVKRGWKWLALGTGAMFIFAGAGGGWKYGLPLANFGEILFTLGVVSTLAHLGRRRMATVAARS
ncbi:MAG: hypothetical protein FJ197_07355 [Gammaproteobacteria bacterium]|nr:hypothetical protein [Gammaproteobacteria bacterium]